MFQAPAMFAWSTSGAVGSRAAGAMHGCLCTMVLLATLACDGPPPNATGANPPAPTSNNSLVRLSAEEIKTAGIVVQPVTRQEFRTTRDFPGTIEPNEHALAEITTLVRGADRLSSSFMRDRIGFRGTVAEQSPQASAS